MGYALGNRGQATVEYLLVTIAFLALVLGLSGIWVAARSGVLQRKVRDAAPHSMEGGMSLGLLQDLSSF